MGIKTTKDVIPEYYENPSGIPPTSRLSGGIYIGSNSFTIARKMEFEVNSAIGSRGTVSKSHGLGFVPQILGTFWLKDDKIRQMLNYQGNSSLGVIYWVYIEDVTKNTLKIGYSHTDNGYGKATIKMVVKLFLLDLPAI